MPRPKATIPKLCVDKSRNRAFCKVGGKFVSLGPAGTAAAQEAYGKLLASLARGETLDAAKNAKNNPAPSTAGITLNTILLRFATEEMPRYSTDEQWCLRSAIRTARELFGATPAEQFGPLKVRLVRDSMVAKGRSRSFTNKQIKRLRLILRWAVSWELIPQSVVDSLATVKALAAGETDAVESRVRQAVSEEDLALIRSKLCRQIHKDLFDLMLLCGSRPGELVGLTVGEIDRSGELWRVDLVKHKTRHNGKSRTLFFNAKAQLILRKYLKADPQVSQRLKDAQARLEAARQQAKAAKEEKEQKRAAQVEEGSLTAKSGAKEAENKGAAANDIRTREGLQDVLIAYRGQGGASLNTLASQGTEQIKTIKEGNTIHEKNRVLLDVIAQKKGDDKPIG